MTSIDRFSAKSIGIGGDRLSRGPLPLLGTAQLLTATRDECLFLSTLYPMVRNPVADQDADLKGGAQASGAQQCAGECCGSLPLKTGQRTIVVPFV